MRRHDESLLWPLSSARDCCHGALEWDILFEHSSKYQCSCNRVQEQWISIRHSCLIIDWLEDGCFLAWQCSSVYVDGWTLPGFDPPPNTFADASSEGTNGVAPWGVRLPHFFSCPGRSILILGCGGFLTVLDPRNDIWDVTHFRQKDKMTKRQIPKILIVKSICLLQAWNFTRGRVDLACRIIYAGLLQDKCLRETLTEKQEQN